MTSSWFNAAFHCFIVILIIHIKHLFTLFLNFYIQSTLNRMTSCHGATPTVNSRCTNPTRVHRSWLWVHDFTRWMERFFTARELVITTSMERSIRPRSRPEKTWSEVTVKDCQTWQICKEYAVDRRKWRNLIKDRVPVSECLCLLVLVHAGRPW